MHRLTAQKAAIGCQGRDLPPAARVLDCIAAKGAERKNSFKISVAKGRSRRQYGEVEAQISRAYQVINETQASL